MPLTDDYAGSLNLNLFRVCELLYLEEETDAFDGR
jgi:hypothetical protein